jgi:site-specific DNA-methyltransferase (adenine-specific)
MHLFGQGFPKSHNFGRKLNEDWHGYGTALKPAWEGWTLAMKPLDETYIENAEKWGVAGINVDESRIATQESWPRKEGKENQKDEFFKGKKVRFCESHPQGRWPSNLLLDEFYEQIFTLKDNIPNENGTTSSDMGSGSSHQRSEERQQNREFGSARQFDSQKGTQRNIEGIESTKEGKRRIEVSACDIPEKWLKYFEETENIIRSPYCSAAELDQMTGNNVSRFFYCAKASSSERNRGLDKPCSHPTVKPITLMKYILRLLAPPGNPVCLDPFAGSGSTLVAAKELGISCIGIEKEEDYVNIAKARIEAARFIPEQLKIAI